MVINVSSYGGKEVKAEAASDRAVQVTVEARANPDRGVQLPMISNMCTFRGARKEVMDRVWRTADELESKGVPLDYGAFGYLIKKKWAEVKEEQRKLCRPITPEELEKLLK